jgi:hypothetical protein
VLLWVIAIIHDNAGALRLSLYLWKSVAILVEHFFVVAIGVVPKDGILCIHRMRVERSLSATRQEKITEHAAAIFSEHSSGDIYAMVELRVIHDVEHAAAGPRLGVFSGVNEAADSSVEDGASAHRTWLERDVEGATLSCGCEKAVVPERASSLAYGDNLTVCGWIAVAEHTVLAAAQDGVAVGPNHDCANWYLACSFSSAGFRDGEAHHLLIAFGRWFAALHRL